jgi:hypothetical protein
MSSEATSDRKRKPTPEAVGSIDDQSSRKAHRASANASASPNVTLMVKTVAASVSEQGESVSVSDATQEDESMESIGKLIQDLFHSDNAKVNAALVALDLDLIENENKCEKIQAAGGCLALVQVVVECLKKATGKIPARDRATELDELDELQTLDKSLGVIYDLTSYHNESRVGISSVGGVEAIVKAMKTFPKCHDLQASACVVLHNLSRCNLGKKNAVESGGLQLLLAAVNNHLDSVNVCWYVCWILLNIVEESKENIRVLISLGGATAVFKVREEWPDNVGVQNKLRSLAKLIGTEINSWADEK